MALKGRPLKKDVVRTPSRQISRVLKREEGLFHPAATKRAALNAMAGMCDPQWGTVIGRLFLQEKLTSIQYEAGKRWDALAKHYHTAMQAPSPNPKAPAIDFSPKSNEADPNSDAGMQETARHRSAVDAFNDAHACLCQLGQRTEKAVRDTCEHGMEPVGYDGLLRLRDGLGTLGDFWQLGKIRP